MHHGEGLRRLLEVSGSSEAESEALIEALASDHTVADVASADRIMLDYAARLTTDPASVTGSDVDALRAAGFDDRAIHDICAITAYYAFVNRIADGLGVELEEGRGRSDGK